MKEQFNTAWSNLIEKLGGWFNTIIESLPNFLLAILVMVAAYYSARYVNKIVTKAASKKVSQPSISKTLGRITAVLVVLTGLFLCLGILNLSTTLKSLLAGAGVVGLAIGLALQGTLANTFAGVILSFRKKIQVGHWIETTGYEGEVIDINLKDFTLKEADNNMVIIPNKTVLENPMKNYSLTNKMRIFLECGVGYESDLEFVQKLTKQTIASKFDDIESPEDVEFFYKEFGGSSINFLCRFWIHGEKGIDKLLAKNKAIIELKKAFDDNDINIPFPIRTLQFDNKLSVNQPLKFEEELSRN